MKLLVYRPKHFQAGYAIQEQLEALAPEQDIEIYETADEFKIGLRRPDVESEIGVLVFSESVEMEELIKFKVLLKKLRLILVLPDCRDEMIGLAYKFAPKFITYADADFSLVQSVVERMTRTPMAVASDQAASGPH